MVENKWNSPTPFFFEDGTPLDPDVTDEGRIEMAGQAARAKEITRQEMEKESQLQRRRPSREEREEIERTENRWNSALPFVLEDGTPLDSTVTDEGLRNGIRPLTPTLPTKAVSKWRGRQRGQRKSPAQEMEKSQAATWCKNSEYGPGCTLVPKETADARSRRRHTS